MTGTTELGVISPIRLIIYSNIVRYPIKHTIKFTNIIVRKIL